MFRLHGDALDSVLIEFYTAQLLTLIPTAQIAIQRAREFHATLLGDHCQCIVDCAFVPGLLLQRLINSLIGAISLPSIRPESNGNGLLSFSRP